MRTLAKDIAFVVLLVISVTALYFAVQYVNSETHKKIVPPPASVDNTKPAVQYPVSSMPNAGSSTNPPSGDAEASNSSLSDQLEQLLGKLAFKEFVQPGDLIRNFVVTVTNFSASRLPLQYLPVRSPDSKFEAEEVDGKMILGKKVFSRYNALVDTVTSLDLNLAVRIYQQFYPLIQKEYSALGQNRYFNDKFIEAIDQLLKTPNPKAAIEVLPRPMSYEFANSELENLPIGEKILVRMGPENEKKIKSFLKTLREKLMHLRE